MAFPTETVYGLGANALSPDAVARIFEVKRRPHFNPLIVHVARPEDIGQLVKQVPPAAKELIRRFWPGALSIVLEKRGNVPDIVTAGLPYVAVRCPAHPLVIQLIEAAEVPIAAPSANLSCSVSPTTAQHVIDQFGDQIPYVLDGGPCQVGVESTVISFQSSPPTVLRPGGVTVEEIEKTIGSVRRHVPDEQRPTSPGQLPKHYSPATPLILTRTPPRAGARVALLSFGPPESKEGYEAVEVLSESKCLRDAASNLFAAIRRLDALGLDYIAAEPVPEIGIGRAIMDRLRRAASTMGDGDSHRPST